jgi:hypothetical protein
MKPRKTIIIRCPAGAHSLTSVFVLKSRVFINSVPQGTFYTKTNEN